MPNPCPLYPQKWTLVSAVGMSAKGQKRTSPCSFDHLIGALLEMYGHVKAKRLSGFQIDHQLEFDWSLHGKLAWFFSPLRMRSTYDAARRKLSVRSSP